MLGITGFLYVRRLDAVVLSLFYLMAANQAVCAALSSQDRKSRNIFAKMHRCGTGMLASQTCRTAHFFLFKARIKRGLGALLHSIRAPKSEKPSISLFHPVKIMDMSINGIGTTTSTGGKRAWDRLPANWRSLADCRAWISASG